MTKNNNSALQQNIQQNIERIIAPEILKKTAYFVPENTGLIKLDAMENPYILPDQDLTAIAKKLIKSEVNRYPDANLIELKELIKKIFAIDDIAIENGKIEVLLGNGSDELIQLLIMAQLGYSRSIMALEPSFVMYKNTSEYMCLPFVGIPLEQDFSLDINQAIKLIETHQPGIIFLSQPNNPTSNLLELEQIELILQTAPDLVVLDEAYFSFHDNNYLPLLAKYPNLLIMRTFSKMGLAGIRLGFLLGNNAWIEQLEKMRLPYNINSLTQVFAKEALSEGIDALWQQCADIVVQRKELTIKLQQIRSLKIWHSSANFIVIKTPENQANDYFAHIKQQGVLIKNLNNTHPILQDCLRITVGSEIENNKLVQILQEYK